MALGDVAPTAGPSRTQNAKKSKKDAKPKTRTSKLKKLTEKQIIDQLEKEVMSFVPSEDVKAFADLPLSEPTKRGLKKAFFVNMTDIQRDSIPRSLKGKDERKTLAFLVPVLEILYRQKWGLHDGLGALIVSPTRELYAVQIFEVLRSIGGYHTFSAGLVIGGKSVKDESERLSKMNILVATPGRLLQHMDQTVGFDAGNLQILVLDEADRILDMGFQRTLTALLEHLPKSRQTLLFSATQTDSVSDLARLSLKDPVKLGSELTLHPPQQHNAQNLEQHYLVVDLDKKLDVLWSFIKLISKPNCKQVRFVFETFCKMHPGIPLLHLQGKQKQSARLTMYQRFISMKHAVLIATDIAARGLDFPSIDWVIQVDAPEDAETYIHRVGRTAEEEGMKAALEKKGIEVSKIKNKASKTQSIKYLGQRAFVSYMRSIYLHKDKTIFKLEDLPVDRFAESLGLPGTPKIKFFSKAVVKQKKNASRADEFETSSEEEEEEKPADDAKSSKAGMNQNVLSSHYSKLIEHDPSTLANDDDDFIVLKRADHDLDDPSDPAACGADDADNLSKRKQRLSRAKKAIITNGLPSKLIFDDQGNPHQVYEMADPDAWYKDKGGLEGVKEEGKLFAQEEGLKLRKADVLDKAEAREKKREKKRKRKRRRRLLYTMVDQPMTGIAVVEPPSDDDGYVSPEFDLPSEDDDDDGDMAPPPSKRNKFDSHTSTSSRNKRSTNHLSDTRLDDEEELALRLLGRA
ncbi:P-loop containing nucleoside triphosphate hydrolase protein [Gymnopilus junonius]|uniref:ATP-dependent RNA helicase n=1 Tax=Gymnopilus junonius TaxID=109634 RepID=A0A9P5NX05_GYMJU|nr:P-loop containing nucleoside triphosphate hydrolase protein [Gymnopilus junonius]